MAGPSLSRQIADDLSRSISVGELRPGAVIPSERELRERYQTTKSTINRAIALLQAEGVVRTEFGRGTFVQDIPKVKRVRRIPAQGDGTGSSFAEEMLKSGLEPDTKLVQAEVIRPSSSIAMRLGINDSDQVIIRKRHMFANQRPVQLASSYIPLAIAGSLDLAFPDTGPTGIYERLATRGFHVARFVEEIESRQPTDEEVKFLKISKFLYVLEVSRRACDRVGRTLEVTINVLPSTLWQLSYEWTAE